VINVRYRPPDMIFLVMAPCGPLYFLEKHLRRPAGVTDYIL
jgi:hypothetical protein